MVCLRKIFTLIQGAMASPLRTTAKLPSITNFGSNYLFELKIHI